MNYSFVTRSIVVALMAVLLPIAVDADTIVDTGQGPPGPYGGYSVNSNQSLAVAFELLDPATIMAVNGWIGPIHSSELTISVLSGGGGGTLLASGWH